MRNNHFKSNEEESYSENYLQMRYISENKDKIIEMYEKQLDLLRRYSSTVDYRASGYPGNFDEFCKLKAKEEMINRFEGKIAGRHIPGIIITVIDNYNEEKARAEKARRNSRNESSLEKECQ